MRSIDYHTETNFSADNSGYRKKPDGTIVYAPTDPNECEDTAGIDDFVKLPPSSQAASKKGGAALSQDRLVQH